MARPERREFVVVGAGLLGLATARALHRRGRDVVVLEQATVGHRRGGSHGLSRIFRLGYPVPIYVTMALSALELWRELEVDAGVVLLERTGQLSVGRELQPMHEAMVSAGAPVEWLSAGDVRARFPDVAPFDGPALFEPASGVLAADRCLAALRAAAGCEVREGQPVVAISDDGVVTTATDTLHADRMVLTPGAWSTSVAAMAGCSLPTFTTREHVAYLRRRDGAAVSTPVFIAHDPPAVYGLPTAALGLYKVGLHHAGAVVDPDDPTAFDVDPRAVVALERATRRWLPAYEARAVLVETCPYDNTADEHFVLDRVGASGRVVVGAGTSGHGFKFGPLLGELLADLATGAPPRMPLESFALARPALTNVRR